MVNRNIMLVEAAVVLFMFIAAALSTSVASSRREQVFEVSTSTVRAIEAALASEQREPITIQAALIVRADGIRPFVCGIYDTRKLRAAGAVTSFMWREGQGLIPGNAHDNHYACMDRLVEAL